MSSVVSPSRLHAKSRIAAGVMRGSEGSNGQLMRQVSPAGRPLRQVAADVLHQEHQVERIGRRLFETVFQVEGPGPGMFCMNQDHAGPDDAGRFTRPGERVLQQRRSETATFVPNVSGEPSEQDRRYGLRL